VSTHTNIHFEDWEAERMRDSEFRAAAEELEPAYQVARLRIMRGLTQKELADMIGSRQSSIARLESGRTQPRLSFLHRIVEALKGRLEIRIVPEEEVETAQFPTFVTMRSYQIGNLTYTVVEPRAVRPRGYPTATDIPTPVYSQERTGKI
jgi:transcriptional regulator with XRE-family HTH domain